MPKQATHVIMFAFFAKLEPVVLDVIIVLQSAGLLLKPPEELCLLFPAHPAGAGRRVGLDKRYQLHLRTGVLGYEQLHQETFVKYFEIAIDAFVHDQRALSIDNMAAVILLITAQAMGMLHDHGIGAHLDHKPAGVSQSGTGNMEFVSPMKQDYQVIILVFVLFDIPDIINQVKRIRAPRLFRGDRKLMFGQCQDAHPNAVKVLDDDPPGGIEVLARANREDLGRGADFQGVL